MSTFDAAMTWLGRGVHVVPLQPNSKRILDGFGFYQDHVDNEEQARFWFAERRCNVAIVCSSVVVLDFDAMPDYARAVERWPVLGEHYTERTRRGVHVYGLGESASGLGEGYEILGRGKVCTVSPSVVGGVVYQVERACSISRFPGALLSLSEKSVSTHPQKEHAAGEDTIARIKRAHSIVDLAQSLTTLRLTRGGRYWVGRCPFHSDNTPSFWVDGERGLWGCHTCGVRGDVINLYSRARGLSVPEAIRQMATVL